MWGARQLCQQRCHSPFGRAVGLEELPHPEQVSASEAALAGHRAREVLRQAIHHALGPDSSGQLGADVLTDEPVQTDEFAVDRLECLRTSLLLDQTCDTSERGFEGLGRFRLSNSAAPSHPAGFAATRIARRGRKSRTHRILRGQCSVSARIKPPSPSLKAWSPQYCGASTIDADFHAEAELTKHDGRISKLRSGVPDGARKAGHLFIWPSTTFPALSATTQAQPAVEAGDTRGAFRAITLANLGRTIAL